MININKVRTYSIKKRFSKVQGRDFASLPKKGKSFLNFYHSLPNILKAKDMRRLTDAVVAARRKRRQVIFMAGAHIIKCGLNPVLIELIKKKVITCICLNGAGIIHDFEIAMQAETSEDVSQNLKTGKFGMGRETAESINKAVNEGVLCGFGLGYSVARMIGLSKLRYKKQSLLYNAYKYKVPVYVYIAIGTDIIHQHPSFDAGLTGQGSLRDFHSLVERISGINDGGGCSLAGSLLKGAESGA